MNTSSLKRVSAFAAAILLICTLFLWTAAVSSHAKSFSEMNEDGYVTDGARGDRPGIIGDERDTDRSARTPAGAFGRDNSSNNNSGLTGNDIPGSTAQEDFSDGAAGGVGGNQSGNSRSNNAADNNAAVLGAQDFAGDASTAGDTALRTFWGIVIALIVAAVVLALVFLLMPKDRSTER